MYWFFIESIWQIDDLNCAEGAAVRADSAASTQKFIDNCFFSNFIGGNTISSCAVDRAEFSAKIVSALVWVAFELVNDSYSFGHDESIGQLFYIIFVFICLGEKVANVASAQNEATTSFVRKRIK